MVWNPDNGGHKMGSRRYTLSRECSTQRGFGKFQRIPTSIPMQPEFENVQQQTMSDLVIRAQIVQCLSTDQCDL